MEKLKLWKLNFKLSQQAQKIVISSITQPGINSIIKFQRIPNIIFLQQNFQAKQVQANFPIIFIVIRIQDMGICMKSAEPASRQPNASELKKSKAQAQVENVDVVKIKLKQARDRIKAFINKKNADIAQIDDQIKEKLPQYQKSKNKKILVPLLQAKKNLLNIVEQGDVRLKLVNQKLGEVQMAQLNKDTIEVLDQSNQYINQIQNELENKDWRGVLADAQNKYELEWPDDRQEVEEDPTFQKMWDELGGNKIAKTVAKKSVKVELNQPEQNQQKLALA